MMVLQDAEPYGGWMRTDRLSYARLFKAALVGALLGLVFDLAVTFLTGPTRGFSVSQIPSSLAFLIVGFAGGWLFELFKAQSEVTDASVRTLADVQDNVARLTRRMTYQDRALTMLLDVPRHNEVLTELIKASMDDNFRNIPRRRRGRVPSGSRSGCQPLGAVRGHSAKPFP